MNYLICSKHKLKNNQLQKPFWGRFVNVSCTENVETILLDPILEVSVSNSSFENHVEPTAIILVLYKPGVTDNSAHAIEEAIELKLNLKTRAHTGQALIVFQNEQVSDVMIELRKNGYNELIHELKVISLSELSNDLILDYEKVNTQDGINYYNPEVKQIEDHQAFFDLSNQSHWGFNQNELARIQAYFADEHVKSERKKFGLTQYPTWIEMECLAQSWSEHCKHKIFAAHIEYHELNDFDNKKKIGQKQIKGIFKTYIKSVTEELKHKKDWLISVFHDNAGIVRFSSNVDICMKVETHNSPSALDPFGGAMTGVLGVQRDIMGTGLGAEPIANLDVFCLAYPDFQYSLPKGLHHPQFILDGVHRGVQSAGNKMGIPTVNGSFIFDHQFAGKPLIYCGTVGVLPHKIQNQQAHQKFSMPGDLIVMVGGRVGKDGIHGATLSSGQMDQSTPSSMVQLGDPFTQKRLLDFLLKARDQLLYSSVTDNGAGGLSSSVGEMAQATGGARLHLDRVPLKYAGLSPYEILISESQERMTFAVPVEKWDQFHLLAKEYAVEATVLGEFTSTGYFEFLFKGNYLGALSLDFLHGGLPVMQLKAVFSGQNISAKKSWFKLNESQLLPKIDATYFERIAKTILSDWNVRSRRSRIEKYDQEVKGASLIRPQAGFHVGSPQNSAVISLYPYGGNVNEAIAIGHGIASHISRWDTYTSAQWALDECFRHLICAGADPGKIAILDNFSWPDPIESSNNPDGAQKLAELVRAGEGLCDLAKIYETPFISGKDSMKNDFFGKNLNGEAIKISALPTVLVSGIGYISNLSHLGTSFFKNSEDLIYLVNWNPESIGLKESVVSRYVKIDNIYDFVNEIMAHVNLKCYQKIHHALKMKWIESISDISEGGIFTAICESLFGSPNLGCQIAWDRPLIELFSEYPGSLLVSVKPQNRQLFEQEFEGIFISCIGVMNSGGRFELSHTGDKIMDAEVSALRQIWDRTW